jgi:serine/threonine protein kinase
MSVESRAKLTWLMGNIADQFTNMKRLGTTPNSVVLSGIRTEDSLSVAIKYVEGANGKREAELLVENQHPNIISLVDQFPLGDGHCLVLPMALFGNLLTYMRTCRGVLLTDESGDFFRKIVFQMVQPIEFLHSRGIIHNDIKLENYVVFGTFTEPIIKMIDLGTAERGNGTRMGTVDYASPEKFCGQPITDKSDIWSLGVSVFLGLTGQRPFAAPAASNPKQRQRIVCRKVKAANPTYERRLWVDFPKVEELVRSMIVADPNLRKSAGEILKDPWFDAVQICRPLDL